MGVASHCSPNRKAKAGANKQQATSKIIHSFIAEKEKESGEKKNMKKGTLKLFQDRTRWLVTRRNQAVLFLALLTDQRMLRRLLQLLVLCKMPLCLPSP